jgi:hypothetical protein
VCGKGVEQMAQVATLADFILPAVAAVLSPL